MVPSLQREGNSGINRKSGIRLWTNNVQIKFAFVLFMAP